MGGLAGGALRPQPQQSVFLRRRSATHTAQPAGPQTLSRHREPGRRLGHLCGHRSAFPPPAALGMLEFDLLYDQASCTLHCSILRAKVGTPSTSLCCCSPFPLLLHPNPFFWALHTQGPSLAKRGCLQPPPIRRSLGPQAHGFQWPGRPLCQAAPAAGSLQGNSCLPSSLASQFSPLLFLEPSTPSSVSLYLLQKI